jgi:hypothetical protein
MREFEGIERIDVLYSVSRDRLPISCSWRSRCEW